MYLTPFPLLDAELHPTHEIADLYFQRWDVELFFLDIKNSMGMDVLRCKSPDMMRKEILMHLIAYNCIRCLMLETAVRKNIVVRRISFKASLQALRQWEPHLNQAKVCAEESQRLIGLLYESIAGKYIPEHTGKLDTREVKR